MAEDVHVHTIRTLTIFLLTALLVDTSPNNLFSETDGITLLNDANCQKNLVGSQHVWFVNFYSGWCGHCIRFAPVWKELAAAIHGM